MAQQPVRQGIGATRLIGLFVFMVTAALFAGAAVNGILAGIEDVIGASKVFAYVCATVAALAMLFDAYDLWVRGRRLPPKTAKGLRNIVMIATLGALASILLTREVSLIVYLGPALILYYMVARMQTQAGHRAPAARNSSGRSMGGASSGGAKARQRRGGRKRR
jgi:hypothetical protein